MLDLVTFSAAVGMQDALKDSRAEIQNEPVFGDNETAQPESMFSSAANACAAAIDAVESGISAAVSTLAPPAMEPVTVDLSLPVKSKKGKGERMVHLMDA